MKAKDIMTTNVISVGMDKRLPEIKNIIENNPFHHLPVVDDEERIVGIISDRDLLRQISPFIDQVSEQPRDVDTLNRAAHQVMTRQPITIKAETSMSEVVTWFQKVDVSCLPVVDENEHIIGIISWRDLILHATFTKD